MRLLRTVGMVRALLISASLGACGNDCPSYPRDQYAWVRVDARGGPSLIDAQVETCYFAAQAQTPLCARGGIAPAGFGNTYLQLDSDAGAHPHVSANENINDPMRVEVEWRWSLDAGLADGDRYVVNITQAGVPVFSAAQTAHYKDERPAGSHCAKERMATVELP